MKFVAPVADPQFAYSKAHGAQAQLTMLERVVSLCSRRRIALDIGAHIGTWTAELVKRFEEVHAFEPQNENHACLVANAPGAHIHHTALSLGTGFAGIAQHGGNSGCWYLIPQHNGDVSIRSLDSYSFDSRVDLIKIDVEGMEGRVLLGATKTLESSSPTIIFEDNGLGAKLYGHDWVDPKIVLEDLGFKHRARINKDEVWSR